MAEQSGLSGPEVLERVYKKITEDGKAVVLREDVSALIADDSDGHRTRQGFVGYKEAMLKNIDGRWWLFSFGKKFGAYPAEPYDCDIAAMLLEMEDNRLKSDDALTNLASFALSKNSYYYYSLMCSFANGNLGVSSDNSYFVLLLNSKANPNDFIIRGLEYDTACDCVLLSTLMPPIKSKALYKENLVDELVKSFYSVLSSYKPDRLYKMIMSHAPIND